MNLTRFFTKYKINTIINNDGYYARFRLFLNELKISGLKNATFCSNPYLLELLYYCIIYAVAYVSVHIEIVFFS